MPKTDDDYYMVEYLNIQQELNHIMEVVSMIEDALEEPGVSASDRMINIHTILKEQL